MFWIKHCYKQTVLTGIRVKLQSAGAKGTPLNQSIAKKMLQYNEIIIVCGRFEGIDQRVVEKHQMKEISWRFYLTGGELGATSFIDTVEIVSRHFGKL